MELCYVIKWDTQLRTTRQKIESEHLFTCIRYISGSHYSSYLFHRLQVWWQTYSTLNITPWNKSAATHLHEMLMQLICHEYDHLGIRSIWKYILSQCSIKNNYVLLLYLWWFNIIFIVIQYNIYSDSIYYYSDGDAIYSNATVLYDMRLSLLIYWEQKLSTSTHL